MFVFSLNNVLESALKYDRLIIFKLRNQLENEGKDPDSIFRNPDHLFWIILRKAIKMIILGITIAISLFILVIIIAHPKCETVPERSWWQNSMIYRLNLEKLCPLNETCFKSKLFLEYLLDKS